MKPKHLLAGLLLATVAATPALAGPYMALDASDTILMMIDRGSIERYGAVRTAKTLYIIKGRPPVIISIRYNCDMGTIEELDQRVVGKDLVLGAPIPAASPPVTKTPPAGSLGHSALINVCQDRVANASGGWTRGDLKAALEAGQQSGYAPTWP